MSDRHDTLATLFGELCDRAPDEQARALAEMGARNPELVRELAELLDLDARKLAGPLLDRFGGAVSAVRSAVGSPAGDLSPIDGAGAIGGDRYRVVRKLGEGGLGVVYEVEDLERGERVALKTFRRADSDALFRLKREFRALAGIEHPNLVSLYDLVVDEARAFFTMELIDGTDALDYVRGDEGRLRHVLSQLAQGLAALHAVGKLHRDIKPSNVRVARDGRVVLLDFGLAVDVGELEQDSLLDAVAGTLAYMSPEQACAERDLGPATDWYAFGVLLYEALTGALPFSGRPIELLAKKTQRVAPPPGQLRPDVPDDLDALCRGLLERDPHRRLRGAAVLEALGVASEIVAARGDSSSAGGLAITGRDAEIQRLIDVFDEVQHTRDARVIAVSGPSGIGKSALVAELLRRLRRRAGDVVVLRGRCYESEAVSYRAMDGLIDELSRYWRKLPDLEAGYLCPQEPHLLPVLFPVLGRVAAVAQRRRREGPADPTERRDRAYAALRETFRKLATDRPTVMFIDDAQWTDAESAALLAELLRPPHMPPLLVVLAFREDDATEPGQLPALLRQIDDAVEVLAVPPLSPEAGESIAASLLGHDAIELSRRIVREAEGNPFFLTELCRSTQASGATPDGHVTVDDLVRARVAALSDSERGVLELVAVAAEPVAEEVIETAAALAPASFATALRALRAVSLVRTAGGRGDDAVECFHARVREAVVSHLTAVRRRQLHEQLAEALELAGNAAAERLARHWRAAGDAARAARWASRAADDALRTLDFSRAADLLGVVLELGGHDEDGRRALLVRRGDALAEAGRPAEAASAFEQAIATAPADERLALQQRVVQQLLSLGKLERGLDAAAALARSVGWRLPRSPLATIARIVVNQIRLRVGGDDPKIRDVGDAAIRRTRFEIASALARSLSLTDTLRGVVCTQYALRVAGPLRDADVRGRMLAMRTAAASARGDVVRARRLLGLADALAAGGSPAAKAYAHFGRGFHDLAIAHDWPAAIANFEAAIQRWRDAGRGEGWELDSTVMMLLLVRGYHGEVRALNELVPRVTMQYARSGRRVIEVTLRARHAMQAVLADAPERALAEVDDALSTWPDKRETFLMQHMYGLITSLHAELYRGRADAAAASFAADRKLLRRSLLLRVVPFRLEFDYLDGRIQLALAAGADGERARHRRRALARARRLAKLGSRLPRAYAALLRAGAANLVGDDDGTIAELRDARAHLAATETRLHLACVEHRLGTMIGGDEGGRMTAEANLWMARQDVAHPERTAALFVPGWPHPDR